MVEDRQPKVWLPVLRVVLDNLGCNILLVRPRTSIPDASMEITRLLEVRPDASEVDD